MSYWKCLRGREESNLPPPCTGGTIHQFIRIAISAEDKPSSTRAFPLKTAVNNSTIVVNKLNNTNNLILILLTDKEIKRPISACLKIINIITKNQFKNNIHMVGIIIRQLREKSIKQENINATDECTFDLNEKYFSYRRDKPETIEAMVAYIGIK